MDLNKLSTGDKVIGGSGIALLIFSFFPWFSFDAGPFGSVSQSGWDFFFTGIIPVLLGVALVGFVVATKLMDVAMPDLPVPQPLLILGLGGAAALLVVLRLLMGGDDGGTGALDRSFGLFLSVLAAIGLAAGAFLKFQEEGGELPTKGGSSGQGGSATPF